MNPRWAVLVLTIVAAIAVVATAWWSYAGVRDARAELERGQAALLLDQARRAFPHDHPPSPSEVEAVRADLGVTYLAFDRIAAGHRDGGYVLDEPLPPPPPGMGPPPGPPPHLVIEIAPVADEVVARAQRTLIAACVAAALLIGGGVIAFRRIEAGERQRRLASLGTMSAVLAHEIKNPLASLKGNAQLAEESFPDDPRIARVVSEAVRLEALTRDLLDFVRTGALDRTAVSPAELVRAAAAEVGGSIEIDDAAAPPTWSLDPARLRQALVNLLQNAREASDRVSVRVWSEGRLRIEVRDRGKGIEGGDAIFEPFHTTKVQGTGLGLAVVRRIVELHGGKITARNHPEGGAILDVRIP